MVTDLTATRRDEREICVGAACDVTGETGELFVAVVRERVNGIGDWGLGTGRCAWRIGIAFPFSLRVESIVHGHAPQGSGRVEGLWRIHTAVAPLFHRRMAAGAIARIDFGGVRLMAERALLPHGAVRLPDVERLVTPVGMASS